MRLFVSDNKFYSVEMAFTWANMLGKANDIPFDTQMIRALISYSWTDGYGKRISPMDVLTDQGKLYKGHWERIKKADLKYPILVVDKGDSLIIMDGYHRLAKAHHLCKKKISAILIPPSILEKFYIGTVAMHRGNVNPLVIADIIATEAKDPILFLSILYQCRTGKYHPLVKMA